MQLGKVLCMWFSLLFFRLFPAASWVWAFLAIFFFSFPWHKDAFSGDRHGSFSSALSGDMARIQLNTASHPT